MLLNRSFRYFSLLLCIAFTFVKANAQSYILIQADKDISFNVKANNKVLPQYGKSYAIISQLTAGTQKIFILFPKGDSPAQRFLIEVPEKGSRNFLLTHYQGAISLYDIQNLSYVSGEAMTEKQMANEGMERKNMEANIRGTEIPQSIDSIHIDTEIKDSSLISFRPNIPGKKELERKGYADTMNNKGYNDKTEKVSQFDLATVNKPIPSPATTLPSKLVEVPLAKTNSVSPKGCGAPITEKVYDDIYIKSLQKTDKERLKYLLGNLKYCFSSNQVRVLTITLNTDPERYSFLKRAYAHVSDKANFPGLESTLSKQEWKDYFESFLQ